MNDISLDQLPYDPLTVLMDPMVEITQSAMTTFMRCPQKYVFRYLMLLERRGIKIPLLIGSAVHNALEVLLDPADTHILLERLPHCLRAIDDTFDEALEDPTRIMGLEDKIEHSRAVAHACIRGWYIINGDDLEGWKRIHTELNVRTVKGATIDSPLEHRMAGKLDGLIEDPDQSSWLIEHKTAQRLGRRDALSLELDTQTLWYMTIMRSLALGTRPDAEEILQGTPTQMPQGFLYDVIQKPQHRMSSRGFDDLVNRMIGAMTEDPQKYFVIAPVIVEPFTLDRARINFVRIVQSMDALREGLVWQNWTACDDWGGCPYWSLCTDRADANHPQQVLNMPGIDQFTITPIHQELDK